MNTKLVLFCLLFICPLLTHSQTLTPEQLRADLAYFRTALNEVHPATYRYTPKAKFDSLYAAVAAQLNHPLTQHEFYVTMTPLLVALRDGHIKWLLPGKDEHYPFFSDKLFPAKLYFLDNKAWIVGNYGTDTLPIGAEVLTINDQPIATVLRKLLPNMTFADGNTKTGKYEDLNHFFSGFYATYIGAPTVHKLTYRAGDVTQTVELPAVSLAAITTYNERHKPSPQPAHRVTFNDSTRTAVLTIERFWTENNEQKFNTFLAETFRQIKAKNVANLVLDLRNNEGGEEKYGVWLYRYLAQKPFRYYERIRVRQKKAYSFPAWTPKLYRMFRWLAVRKRADGYVFTKQTGLKRHSPQRDAFGGKLYVLVNGGSFSVTTELAARIHADKRATFLGQETGGAYEGNSSGIFTITQLPNSKIDFGIPMFGYYMANLPAGLQTGQGIRPDHVLTPTINDVLSGTDRTMHYVRQLIWANQEAALKR
ncbi:S41 family peptidase [Spirosoma sp. BT702]|uniref:S41 family peptidase n=1 Tax=Spirosoma profusum TaxID=2771354 RepID=A0A926XZE3_9BACT|nr:S41 family peptidase [Spirosoma profusum]MBD2703081.1 S41 family peptidase [Spirosoma profusum]